ncbi:MAG: type II secretion system minor pseudopilin GspI [Fimbriimonadaceae bacterium]|nr:type II secretion system minor pseudopilin GspI [Fimbriimonadaceae bacterium]
MRRGFTLLELIVAVAILAVALVGVLQAVSQSTNHIKEARDRAAAMELAEQKLAELLLNPELAPGEEAGDFGELAPRFSWQSSCSETELAGLLRLRVTVAWNNGRLERSVDVETCYAVDALVDPVAEQTAAATAAADATAAASP